MLTNVEELRKGAERLQALLKGSEPQTAGEKLLMEHFRRGEEIGKAEGLSPLIILIATMNLLDSYKETISDAVNRELICAATHILKIVTTDVLVRLASNTPDDVALAIERVNKAQDEARRAIQERMDAAKN